MRHRMQGIIHATRLPLLLLVAMAMLASLLSVPAHAAGETVGVWVTTADQSKLLQQQPNLTFAADSGSNPTTIDVNAATTYQQIDGFGASLTDSSASLICGKLTTAQRDTLLNNLFNPNTGIGLSFLRQPMGASDFSSIGNYSYDDMPAGQTDANLTNFNITHDLQCIVPLLKQIKTINPALKLMANPWSPPGWMKTSGSMIGGNLQTTYRTAWANYFVKFVQAYAAQGLPIDYISMQNEPLYIPPGYPGMGMSASEQATLLASYMGPAFAQAGITSKILVWDHNWTNQYPYDVLGNATANSYAAGTAFHWYGGSVTSQTDLHNSYPAKGIWFTEGSGFSGTSFAQYLKDIDQLLIIANMRNWGKSTVRWNLVLDQNLGPQNGGCNNCTATVTINNSTGAITYNAEYYALAHASKFVVPGAYRIDSNNFAGGIENVAFRNPDGSIVVLAFNAGTASNTFKVRWSGQSFSATLPAGAVGTYKWAAGTVITPTSTQVGPTATRTNTPVASANLALNKPVTCSSIENAGTACANAVDGNTGTRWASAFSDPQWIQVDLGATYSLGRVVLTWEAAYGKAYQIQVSNDAATWTTIYSTTTGDGGSDDLTVSGSGRYVRMYGTVRATGYGYSLWEFQVYGAGGATFTPTRTLTLTSTPIGTITRTPTVTACPAVTGHVRVGSSTGPGLAGVLVTGTATGVTLTGTTDSTGSYVLSGCGRIGMIVTPQLAGYTFAPTQQTFNGAALDFVATASATPTPTATAGACGTTNVALNKPATSSSNESAGTTPNLAVDGNTATRWSSTFSDPQWIQIDLGSTQTICRIILTWETAYGKAYQIQVSNDAVTWTTIYSTTTGDGGSDDLTGLTGSGRYVRMYGTVRGTGYGYSLWEFGIYP